MFEKFYGLARNPFNLTPDPSLFYFSSQHEEALSRLIYAVKNKKGLVVLTGEVGTGKTTVIRKLISSLGPEYNVILVFNTFLSSKQIIETILVDLNIEYKRNDSKVKMIHRLYDFLIAHRRQGRAVVLVIDEAQNLSPKALEEVRMLTNLETDTEKLLQIVLVGQPELKDLLSKAELRQMKQRIYIHYHLYPLPLEDVYRYIDHRIIRSGGRTEDLFTEESVSLIAKASGGVPRVINILCDNCLITGFANGERPVGVITTESVLQELGYDVTIGESLWEE